MMLGVFSDNARVTPLTLISSPVQTEAGRIGLEGCLCDDYYKIRELLYQQYAVV